MRFSRMPTVGILTGSIALTAALALALGGSAVPATAATVNYVALGDSYSSGVGAGTTTRQAAPATAAPSLPGAVGGG